MLLTPSSQQRDEARKLHEAAGLKFIECHVATPIRCELSHFQHQNLDFTAWLKVLVKAVLLCDFKTALEQADFTLKWFYTSWILIVNTIKNSLPQFIMVLISLINTRFLDKIPHLKNVSIYAWFWVRIVQTYNVQTYNVQTYNVKTYNVQTYTITCWYNWTVSAILF